MLERSLFFGLVAIYCISAVLSVIFNKKDRFCLHVPFIGAAISAVLGTVFSLTVIFGEIFSFSISKGSFLEFGFYVDRLSAFFILIISIAVFAVSIYSTGYLREYAGKKNIGYLGFLYNIFILSMILVITADNAVMFLIVWELMSVISYFLVVYEHEKPETRKAGFIYIVMTHFGTGFIILSFLIFAGTTGSFSFDTFRNAGLTPLLKDLAFLFALIGFGAKAGIVPLHIWLPHAHPAAPANVSALMSGVMIKTAIFMLIRVSFDFLGASGSWWGYVILALGTISAIIGILYAVIEPDIKRMLAYSSIENIGIILTGMGASMIFFAGGKITLSAVAMIAALYHLLNHSVFKSLLFMGAGSIIYSTHTRNIERLGGLIKKMPVSAILILTGVLSISALPPFSGFVSEWLTLQSLLLAFNMDTTFPMIVLSISAAFLALTGALAAYCFLKSFGLGFLALPRSEDAEHAKEVNMPMLSGMGVLALLSILLGILPFYIVPVLGRMTPALLKNADTLSTGAFGTVAIPSHAVSISTPAILVLLLVFILISSFLVFNLHRRNQPSYETWGCGQPVSNARNEYTATAFSKPVQMWFKGFYRPSRETEATYSASRFHKESIKFESRIEQLFEQYLYEPAVQMVVVRSRKARMIQTGSIHAYLGYIFGILVILFMFVIIGGS